MLYNIYEMYPMLIAVIELLNIVITEENFSDVDEDSCLADTSIAKNITSGDNSNLWDLRLGRADPQGSQAWAQPKPNQWLGQSND